MEKKYLAPGKTGVFYWSNIRSPLNYHIMSTKINRDDWSWLSLFAPKSNDIQAIENGYKDYEVEEEYVEADDIKDKNDD
jgi:hypothetical protein